MGVSLVPLAKEPAMTALRQRMLEDMQIRNLAPGVNPLRPVEQRTGGRIHLLRGTSTVAVPVATSPASSVHRIATR